MLCDSEVDKQAKQLVLQVWDRDLIGSDDAMGGARVELSALPDGSEVERVVSLTPLANETVSGSITLRYLSTTIVVIICSCYYYYCCVVHYAESESIDCRCRLCRISAQRAAANNSIAAGNYAELVGLLVQSQDIIVVASLCTVYSSDEVARTLVALFESQHQAHRLLNQLLFREIKQVRERNKRNNAFSIIMCFFRKNH